MELIAVGQVLWARRRLVGVGLLLSILIGASIAYNVSLGLPPKLHSRQHLIGQAVTQVLIDTPTSQVVHLGSQNDATLYEQATLLADLMASAPVQEALARDLRIPVAALKVTPPPSSIVQPIRASPLALAGENVSAVTATWKFAIAVDPSLPIISLSAQAPTPRGALRLVSDAIAILRERLDAVAVSQHVPDSERLVVNAIDPPSAGPLLVGPRKLYGFAATVITFLAINFVIVIASGVLKRRVEGEQIPSPMLRTESVHSVSPVGADRRNGISGASSENTERVAASRPKSGNTARSPKTSRSPKNPPARHSRASRNRSSSRLTPADGGAEPSNVEQPRARSREASR
jgi:hypothetical protein